MIHIFIGTKAQFIKMAPIMIELDQQGIVYNYISSGQHAELLNELSNEFNLRRPDVALVEQTINISSIFQAIVWILKLFIYVFIHKNDVYSKVFKGEDGICLIHGDTITTLVSLIYAKRCGLKVAHIEAGLRSYHLFDPFPEEIIRLLVMRFSDLLFTPSDWAFGNACRMGYVEKTINVNSNTGIDAVRYIINNSQLNNRNGQPHVLLTIHRVETIYSKTRMTFIVDFIESLAMENKVIFVLHEPTKNQLIRYNLYNRLLTNSSIVLLPLQPYGSFIYILASSEFVITDGGSIQEECYYLNIPCILMRKKTERREGIGENVLLSSFDLQKIKRFMDTYPGLKTKTNDCVEPSRFIVRHLLAAPTSTSSPT